MANQKGFRRWHEAGFTSDLLPIIPVSAPLTDGTTVKAHHLGKVPGTLTATRTWSGLGGKWSDSNADVADCVRWAKWGASVGLQGRNFPGLDIDVDDPELAAEISQLAFDMLGLGPVRTRPNSSRRLHIFKGTDDASS